MHAKHKQQHRGWLGRTAATVALCAGLIAAPTTNASAAEAVGAFTYQVVDCSTPGLDFGVALGTPEEPIGPVEDEYLRANVINGAVFVMPVQLRTMPDTPNTGIRWATVPPNVEFTLVRFEWEQDGEPVYLNTPAAEPEVCDGPETTSESTNDPGPGLTPVAPVRLLDSRRANAPEVAQVAAGQTVRVKVGGANGVPAAATAAMLNVTAANPTAPGFLTVFPCGVAVPKTSSVNYIQGETRAGAAFTKVGSNGEICVYASAATNVVVDLNGYVANSTSPSAITPIRVVDTRPDAVTDVVGTPKGKQTVLTVPVGKFGVGNASNLIINITTVGAEAPGHINVGGCAIADDSLGPKSSVVNFVPGRPQANMAFVRPFAGEICISASSPTHIIVDLVGSMTGSSTLLAPAPADGRLLDTRPGQKTSDGTFEGIGQLKANVPLKLKVRDRLHAKGATAAALNVTAVNESARGHVTVYPCGGPAPLASNLNYVAQTAIANLAFTKLDEQGNVCIVSHVDADVVVDLAATNSSAIQTALLFEPPIAYGWWGWREVRSVWREGQTGVKVALELAGGSPPYRLSGPTISNATIKVTPAGMLTVSVPATKYVIASPEYTLTDSAGHSQTVTASLSFDPQFSPGTFPVP